MALNELTSLIAPPVHPVEACKASQLDLVQDRLGIVLPDDYREYALAYGSGKFRDDSIAVVVFNPCAKVYLERVQAVCTYLAEVRRTKGQQVVPFNLFPDLPGLLPWGWDINGNDLFWLANGSPNEWPVIVRAEGYEFQRHNLPMTSFLARSMKREIKCNAWSQEGFFPDPSKIAFQPETLGLD